jgi:hypothetical protein
MYKMSKFFTFASWRIYPLTGLRFLPPSPWTIFALLINYNKQHTISNQLIMHVVAFSSFLKSSRQRMICLSTKFCNPAHLKPAIK